MTLSRSQNNPWFVSAFTTAAGIAVSKNTSDGIGYGAARRYRLRGFSVSGSTGIAISTTPIKIIYGDSSVNPHTTAQVCNEPGIGIVGVSGIMGIEAAYIAIETTVAHADGGLTFMMWGD